MKYYSYSVKDILEDYFGANTLAAMRKKSQTSLGPEHSKHLIPLSWQYADEQIMHLFLDHKFLIRTAIEDDYIAYIYQEGSQQCALLFYFQRIFGALCGIGVGEYIRCRRLTLAGVELTSSDAKIIDIAAKYGYDSPDSFNRAFQRFHGISPSVAKKPAQSCKASGL